MGPVWPEYRIDILSDGNGLDKVEAGVLRITVGLIVPPPFPGGKVVTFRRGVSRIVVRCIIVINEHAGTAHKTVPAFGCAAFEEIVFSLRIGFRYEVAFLGAYGSKYLLADFKGLGIAKA